MLNNKRLILKILATFGIVGFLTACGGGGGGGDSEPVFNPDVAPQNVQVVSGDGFKSDVSNTISWTYDPAATGHVVYWDTMPGVTVNSPKVDPAFTGYNYIIHSAPEVFAGETYYYLVVATAGVETSIPSAEVFGTPQLAVTDTHLNDVAWNGVNTLVAVGDSGVILNSPNGTADGWSPATDNPATESLAGVTWEDVNFQFLAVGAGGTVITSIDGDFWTSHVSGVATDLEDVAWTGSQYIAVGKNGAILTSNGDGTAWTQQASGIGTALEGVAVSNSIIVAVGTQGTILTSANAGVDWIPVDLNAQGLSIPNDLNDVTWDGSRFGVVGSDTTVLTSDDGINWIEHVPSLPDITFVGTVQWDSSLPVDPILAAVGSAGTFAVSPDSVSGYSVPTGTNEQLSSITWVDDGVRDPYFVVVGHNGTVLTNYQ